MKTAVWSVAQQGEHKAYVRALVRAQSLKIISLREIGRESSGKGEFNMIDPFVLLLAALGMLELSGILCGLLSIEEEVLHRKGLENGFCLSFRQAPCWRAGESGAKER